MDSPEIYVQPLALTRGLTVSGDKFKRLAGGNTYFSAIKIISRDNNNFEEEIINVDQIEDYLKSQSAEKSQKIRDILVQIERERPPLKLKDGHVINWNKPVIQGVLNVTPDSFSDGGEFEDSEKSVVHAKYMIGAGADIIDIGGETTKPGAAPVSIEDEKERVLPVIEKLADLDIPISIDSRNSGVMLDAVKSGAHIINDVSALEHDPQSINTLKELEVPVILMHAQGSPENMQDNPHYDNVVLDIYDYLKSRIEYCLSAGIVKNNIIVDPGIGFGKTLDHNLQLLANISLFHGLGVPLLIGVSRKSFIGKVTAEEIASKRVPGSIAAAQVCLDQGVQIVRVHDVEEASQAISIWNAIGDNGL